MLIENFRYVPSLSFVRRLRRAYILSTQLYSGSDSILWNNVVPQRQKDIHASLLDSDSQTLLFLSDMLSHDLYYGVDNTCKSLWGTTKPHYLGEGEDIIKLAEAVGALRVWNPSGGSKFPFKTKPNLDFSVEETLSILDNKFGFNITFPDPFGCEFGFPTSRGPVTYRAPQALYQAYRVKQFLGLVTQSGHGRVAEIGGGMGRTIYYMRQFGIVDITAIDIPLGMVRQACFLAGALGEDKLWLWGEPPVPEYAQLIKIVPPHSESQTQGNFDVVINVDSLTEMGASEAATYFNWMLSATKFFISINHEANDFCVQEFNCDFFRYPYPLRDGYVEEFFFLSPDGLRTH